MIGKIFLSKGSCAMLHSWSVTVPVLPDSPPRRAYLYVPDYWQEDPSQRFPVLYMFDGHNLFSDEEATYGKSWGLLDFLEESRIPLIVAAVACNEGHHNERLVEYCPFTCDMPGFGTIRGKGKATMDWLTQVFKPEIDNMAPTLPDRDHTFIGGSSMGGLMSLYAITKYNAVFSRCAALSPSIWFGGEKMDRLLSARLRKNTVVYMDYGERELKRRKGMAEGFGQAAARLMAHGALVTSRIVPAGEHNEATWQRQIPFFMDALFYNLDF